MSKRFFAFGCSYTEYEWPTWADILGRHYHNMGYEVYNFGNSGTGNVAIMHAVTKADSDYNFTDDDIICIMWTSWSREDRLARWDTQTTESTPPTWDKFGNSLSNPHYDADWIKKYWSLENDVVNAITTRKLITKAFPQIKFQGSLVHNESMISDFDAMHDNLWDLYDSMQFKNKFFNSDDEGDKALAQKMAAEFRITCMFDGHPLPCQHLHKVETMIGPQIGISSIDDDTRKWVDSWQQRIAVTEAKLLGMIKDLGYNTVEEINDSWHKGQQAVSNKYHYKNAYREQMFKDTAYCKRHHDLWNTPDPIFNIIDDRTGSTQAVMKYLSDNRGLF